MKKVLRITTVPHSLDLLLKGQLKYVNESGFSVIIASNNEGDIQQIEKREGVKHYQLPLTRKFNPLKDLIALFATINLIRREKPDIVHSHSPKAGIVGMLASWICNVPLKIHTVAGLPLVETRGIKKFIYIQIEKITYKCADFILPNSRLLSQYISNNIYENKNKIFIIGKGGSNGVDLDYFNVDAFKSIDKDKFRHNLGISSRDTVFCFVGRLANYKGVNELVEAFIGLNAKYNNLKLLLVGPIEDINPLNAATLVAMKNNKNIIGVGHQQDIRPFLYLSDIFVFPSYREGFPQSLMQAAAMGLPLIATNINGCNEIIINERSGLLIQPKDVLALRSAMETLLVKIELRIKYKEESMLFIKENFEQKKFWNLIVNFYKEKLKSTDYE